MIDVVYLFIMPANKSISILFEFLLYSVVILSVMHFLLEFSLKIDLKPNTPIEYIGKDKIQYLILKIWQLFHFLRDCILKE